MIRRYADKIFLTLVIAGGAFLRLNHLGAPSFWLDEILDYDVATASGWSLWRMASNFQPENGPLFYVSELAGRFWHSPEVSARIAPALFGIATILVAWFAARAIDRCGATPYVMTVLVAASPLQVYYSREARAYALVMLLAIIILALLLRGELRYLIIPLLVAVSSAAVSLPLVVSAGVAALAAGRPVAWRAAVGAGAAALAILGLYPHAGAGASAGFPSAASRLFVNFLESFSAAALDTSHLHRAAYVFFALAVIGAIDLARRNRQAAFMVVIMAGAPIALALTALMYLNHWVSIRYISSALPAYLLLVACGVAAFARMARRAEVILAILIAVALIHEGLPAARLEPFHKLDWRAIASTIEHHAHGGDTVLTTNDWTAICLGFYLRDQVKAVRMINARESIDTAESIVRGVSPVWIVTAGFHTNDEIVHWSCRYPIVLASPLESFRLHYAPSLAHFLQSRATAAEFRAVTSAFEGEQIIGFGPEDDAFLADGWSGVEGEEPSYARWVDGRNASAVLVTETAAERRISMTVMPADDRRAPPQRMNVVLNDTPLATLTLAPGWQTLAIDAPARLWRNGANVLAFDFSRATAPISVDPTSRDTRRLSVEFARIALGEKGAIVHPRVRLADELIDENSAWRGTKSDFSPRSYDRDALTHFVARLGFDPLPVVAKLIAGRITLEEIAQTLAEESACMDDRHFMRAAYSTLVARALDSAGERDFLRALSKGWPRTAAVRGVLQAPECQQKLRGRQRG